MQRVDLSVSAAYRLVMCAVSQRDLEAINKELGKSRLPTHLGLDVGNIVWIGESTAITPAHCQNWIGAGNVSAKLFDEALTAIGNPAYVAVLREDPMKAIVMERLISLRKEVYGESDPLHNFTDDLTRYYQQWSIEQMRKQYEELSKKARVLV